MATILFFGIRAWVKGFKNKKWVVSDLLKEIKFSRSIFNALVTKGIFTIEKESISRLLKSTQDLIENKELADFQKKANIVS